MKISAFFKIRSILLCFACIPVLALSQGLNRHDFFYAGEAKIHHMYMVKNGKIVWHYHNPDSRGEISDACLMDDGNILFAHQYGITEITADQKTVWSINAPEGCEIHSAQPIGKDYVVYVQNGTPAKLIVMHIPTKEIKREFTLQTKGSVHGQFRNARLTDRGTIIVSHMDMGKVCEYDSNGKELWSFEVKSPWSATPLKNGNILITSNTGVVSEINRQDGVVWEVDIKGNPGYKVSSPQVSYRLSNGNTIVNNWFNQWSRNAVFDPANPPLQAIELTPDKKVVWELCAWQQPADLGPSTIIQPLNEPVVRGKMFFGEFK
jgi:outer membrane protein assembly factor BamB